PGSAGRRLDAPGRPRCAAGPDCRTSILRRSFHRGRLARTRNLAGHGEARVGYGAALVTQCHEYRGDMTPERWQEIKKVLDDVLELKPGDRALLLDRACANDASLRKEVELLLAAEEEAGTQFLNE